MSLPPYPPRRDAGAYPETVVDVYPLVVQFEDLDASGIVHHPNYLRFCERARCQAMADRGYSFRQCMADGTAFVVAEVLMRYVRPATQGEQLYVVSANAGYKRSSIKVFQAIVKEPPPSNVLASPGALFRLPGALFHGQLRLVHVEIATGRPLPMSNPLRAAFGLRDEGDESSDPRYGDVRLATEWDAIT